VNVTKGIYVNEGWRAFYRGLVPRVLRVAPGQAITFLVCLNSDHLYQVYEKAYSFLVEMTSKTDNSLEKVEYIE